jgi:hypothetical protein
VECWALQGIEAAMNRFNAPDKPAQPSAPRSRSSPRPSPPSPSSASISHPDTATLAEITQPIPAPEPDSTVPAHPPANFPPASSAEDTSS